MPSGTYVERLVNLLDPAQNVFLSGTAADARDALAANDPDRLRACDGHFALLHKDDQTVRMARSIGRPMRYFLAKRAEGPCLVVAERIDEIQDFPGLDREHDALRRRRQADADGVPDDPPAFLCADEQGLWAALRRARRTVPSDEALSSDDARPNDSLDACESTIEGAIRPFNDVGLLDPSCQTCTPVRRHQRETCASGQVRPAGVVAPPTLPARERTRTVTSRPIRSQALKSVFSRETNNGYSMNWI